MILVNHVENYWNKLTAVINVISENEKSIIRFKYHLEKFKTKKIENPKHYWELSSKIFSIINNNLRYQYMFYLK